MASSKKYYSRRQFIRQGGLSALALFSAPAFSGFTLFNFSYNSNTVLTDIRKAKQLFYRHENEQAQILYEKLIMNNPNMVQLYDGLRKVLSSQNKHIEVIRLCKQGYENNLDNIEFYDRYAKALFRGVKANKKVAEQILIEFGIKDPLGLASQIYDLALQKKPGMKYLELGKEQLRRHRSLSSSNRNNKKINKDYSKNKLSNQIKDLSPEQIKQKKKKNEDKKRRKLTTEREINIRKNQLLSNQKTLLNILADKQIKNQDLNNALNTLKQLYQLDPKDNHSLGRYRRLLVQLGNYEPILKIQIDRFNTSNSLFDGLALLKIILVASKEKKSPLLLQKYRQILTVIESHYDKDTNNGFHLISAKLKFYLLQNDFDQLDKTINYFSSNKLSRRTENLLTIYKAKSLWQQNKKESAIELLEYVVGININQPKDKNIQKFISKRSNKGGRREIPVYCVLRSFYYQIGDSDQQEYIARVLTNLNYKIA